MSSERFEEEFFKIGLQYYAAARSTARAGFMPVTGNLFHHAIEMFLKGQLIKTHSSKVLASGAIGHKLDRLWPVFKKDVGVSLVEFDKVIDAVNQFETIRYPDAILERGAGIRLDWVPFTPPAGLSGIGIEVPEYALVVSDVDRLVSALFVVCSKNPMFFTAAWNEDAREAILFRNESCAGWFR